MARRTLKSSFGPHPWIQPMKMCESCHLKLVHISVNNHQRFLFTVSTETTCGSGKTLLSPLLS